MSNRALELYEQSRPLESLESFIFRTAQRASKGGGAVLRLRDVSNNQGGLEFSYEVDESRSLELQEMGALGGFAVAAAMTVRALLTRRSGHVLGAIQAASVALAFGGREVPRLWRRVQKKGQSDPVTVGLRGSQLSFKVGAEEVRVDLAPITGLTVRTFRFHWESPRPTLHFAHVEMQDGRLLTLTETEDSLAVRRLVHQIAKPVPVEVSFQNIDLYREKDKVSWELGPRLVEPALN
jgi:hypothetical protein